MLDRNGITEAADLVHWMECDRLPDGGFADSYLVLSRNISTSFEAPAFRRKRRFRVMQPEGARTLASRGKIVPAIGLGSAFPSND